MCIRDSHETKKKVEQKKTELKELSNKFRELKSLVYEYKDRKAAGSDFKYGVYP